MYQNVEKWLNEILEQDMPTNIYAFNFNLYEDEDYNWSMELVGTASFDLDDEDWACDELTDFGTRDNPFTWSRQTTWDVILEEMISVLQNYLNVGAYASILKAVAGIGIGFVDGDIEILYSK